MQDTAPQPRPETVLPANHHDVDFRLLWFVCAHAMLAQIVYAMLRVTISYRSVEIGLPSIWVGIIAGASAVLPMLLAVKVGRIVDRGHDLITAKTGAYLMVASCVGLRFSPALAVELIACTVVLGMGHLLLMVAHQMLVIRSAGNDLSRETAFGHYMVATAFGQGAGPLVVAWLGGAQRIPPTKLLFATAFLLSTFGLVLASQLRPSRQAKASKTSDGRLTSLPDLLRTRGVPTLMLASIITVATQDLLVIYLPLLGTEREIDVAHIGTLLMLRSAAAVVARLFYPSMIRAVGRVPLTVGTMVAAGLSMAIVAMPVPLPVLYAAMIMAGFGLGIAATLSISSMVDIVPANARAVSLSLRITGNRVGQVSFPVLAGLAAAATGAGGIFGILAIGLVASATSVHIVRGLHKDH